MEASGEKGDREKHSAMRKCLHFSFLYLSYSSFFGEEREEVSARNGPTFWPDLILTDHVAFGHSSSNSSNDSVRLFLALTWGFGDR